MKKNNYFMYIMLLLVLFILLGFYLFMSQINDSKQALIERVNSVEMRYNSEVMVINSKPKYIDVISSLNNEVYNLRRLLFNKVTHQEILYILSALILDSDLVIESVTIATQTEQVEEITIVIDNDTIEDTYTISYTNVSLTTKSSLEDLIYFIDQVKSYNKKLSINSLDFDSSDKEVVIASISIGFLNLTDLPSGYKLPNVNIDYEKASINLDSKFLELEKKLNAETLEESADTEEISE